MDKTSKELNEEELGKVAGGSGWDGEGYFINHDQCVGCGACSDVCPTGCIALTNGYAVINQDSCIQCGCCENECPTGAINRR